MRAEEDVLQVLGALLRVGDALAEHLGEADDGVERGADVVAHHREEHAPRLLGGERRVALAAQVVHQPEVLARHPGEHRVADGGGEDERPEDHGEGEREEDHLAVRRADRRLRRRVEVVRRPADRVVEELLDARPDAGLGGEVVVAVEQVERALPLAGGVERGLLGRQDDLPQVFGEPLDIHPERLGDEPHRAVLDVLQREGARHRLVHRVAGGMVRRELRVDDRERALAVAVDLLLVLVGFDEAREPGRREAADGLREVVGAVLEQGLGLGELAVVAVERGDALHVAQVARALAEDRGVERDPDEPHRGEEERQEAEESLQMGGTAPGVRPGGEGEAHGRACRR